MADKLPHASIKTELGSTYKRLPSFRTPRDLKLSEFREIHPNPLGDKRTKKVFVPNLNIQRKKHDDKSTHAESSEPAAEKSERKSERGRGRGRKNLSFVQNAGVFSEGLAPTIKGSGWKSKVYEPSSSIPKPKLKLSESTKVDKFEDDQVIKELLRDDFIEDPELEPDYDHCPIRLPFHDYHANVFAPLAKKIEKVELVNGIKIKKEPKVEPIDEHFVEEKPSGVNYTSPSTMAEFISNPSDNNFIFFQIPTAMPNQKSGAATGRRISSKEDNKEPEKKVLRSLPAGRIGTLQIRKSGRTAFILGDVTLNVEPGTSAAFRQDLVSVTLDNDTKTGNMVNLGCITSKMIVTPDWQSLISAQK